MVSVIITTYKRTPDTVKRAVRSTCIQTYRDHEIILVDDNPEGEKLSETTVAGIREMVSVPFSYITYDGNRGACHARNEGVKASSGTYLAFLDDDDEWLEDKLEEEIRVFDDPDCVIATCDSVLVQTGENGDEICENVSYTDKEQITLNDIFTGGNIIGGASFPMIRKEAFDRTGGFKEDLKACQDIDLWIRLLQTGKAVRISKPLVRYHWNPGSNISFNWDSKSSGTEYLVRTYSNMAPENGEWSARQYNSLTDLALTLERYGDAARYMRRSLAVCKTHRNIKRVFEDFTELLKRTVWYRIRYSKRGKETGEMT